MPRSRRYLALCALVASLAWTNVQAMACCWTWSATAATVAGSSADEHSADPVASQRAESAAHASASASCHGPAAMPEAAGATESAHPDEAAFPHDGATTSPHEAPPACGDAFTATPTTPSCCETSAPAETFSAVPHFEALPPHAFYADIPAEHASLRPDDASLRSSASPRFLALERLLI